MRTGSSTRTTTIIRITITPTSTKIAQAARWTGRSCGVRICGFAAMPRVKGTGKYGPTRSARLPLELDRWFGERLDEHRESSPSELLIALIHGGLRLRDGYMLVHYRALKDHRAAGRGDLYDFYLGCLLDTFGPEYVKHLERWLDAPS
jgi:hypothetical protein